MALSSAVSCSIPMNLFWAAEVRMSSSNFAWMAVPSRFWVFWITNTIKNVRTDVAVLMTSCHVSE
jgi:hypothetical protein